jgi:hypothetical protein
MDRAAAAASASASRRAAAADHLGFALSAPARAPRGYYYAAAADHFALAASHLAAAGRYLSTAFRVRRGASALGEASSHGGDLDSELGLPSAPSASSSSSSSSSATSAASPSILTTSGSDAGTDGGRDDEVRPLCSLLLFNPLGFDESIITIYFLLWTVVFTQLFLIDRSINSGFRI